MASSDYHSIHDITVNQIYTKNVIAPNYARLKDLNDVEHELYNFSLRYAGNMWKYQYSGLNAILGEYGDMFSKNNFSMLSEIGMTNTEGASNEREIGVLYVLKFSSIGSIIAGGLTNFAGEATKMTTSTFRLTGILSQNWIVHGIDEYISSTRQALLSGESGIFQSAHSSNIKVSQFYTSLSKMRNEDGVVQLLSEAKDVSSELSIKTADLVNKDLVSKELTKILNYIEDLARTIVPELGIGDRLISDYKVALNSKVMRDIKQTGFVLPSPLLASTLQTTIGNLAAEANLLMFNYHGVDFIGVQEIPEDKIMIITPQFTMAPIKPMWTAFDATNKSKDKTGGISAIVPRVKASTTEFVDYTVALGSPTGTGQFAKVEFIKPCISVWNEDDAELNVKSDIFEQVRDLALVSVTLT